MLAIKNVSELNIKYNGPDSDMTDLRDINVFSTAGGTKPTFNRSAEPPATVKNNEKFEELVRFYEKNNQNLQLKSKALEDQIENLNMSKFLQGIEMLRLVKNNSSIKRQMQSLEDINSNLKLENRELKENQQKLQMEFNKSRSSVSDYQSGQFNEEVQKLRKKISTLQKALAESNVIRDKEKVNNGVKGLRDNAVFLATMLNEVYKEIEVQTQQILAEGIRSDSKDKDNLSIQLKNLILHRANIDLIKDCLVNNKGLLDAAGKEGMFAGHNKAVRVLHGLLQEVKRQTQWRLTEQNKLFSHNSVDSALKHNLTDGSIDVQYINNTGPRFSNYGSNPVFVQEESNTKEQRRSYPVVDLYIGKETADGVPVQIDVKSSNVRSSMTKIQQPSNTQINIQDYGHYQQQQPKENIVQIIQKTEQPTPTLTQSKQYEQVAPYRNNPQVEVKTVVANNQNNIRNSLEKPREISGDKQQPVIIERQYRPSINNEQNIKYSTLNIPQPDHVESSRLNKNIPVISNPSPTVYPNIIQQPISQIQPIMYMENPQISSNPIYVQKTQTSANKLPPQSYIYEQQIVREQPQNAKPAYTMMTPNRVNPQPQLNMYAQGQVIQPQNVYAQVQASPNQVYYDKGYRVEPNDGTGIHYYDKPQVVNYTYQKESNNASPLSASKPSFKLNNIQNRNLTPTRDPSKNQNYMNPEQNIEYNSHTSPGPNYQNSRYQQGNKYPVQQFPFPVHVQSSPQGFNSFSNNQNKNNNNKHRDEQLYSKNISTRNSQTLSRSNSPDRPKESLVSSPSVFKENRETTPLRRKKERTKTKVQIMTETPHQMNFNNGGQDVISERTASFTMRKDLKDQQDREVEAYRSRSGSNSRSKSGKKPSILNPNAWKNQQK